LRRYFWKLEEVFLHNIPSNKNLSQFFKMFYGLKYIRYISGATHSAQRRYLISYSGHRFWYFPCWEVATCQGGFEWLLKDPLDVNGQLHLIFISRKGLMQWGGDILLMTLNKFLKISSLLDFCLFDCFHLYPRFRIQWRRWDST